jgi:putative two-component system response regulator
MSSQGAAYPKARILAVDDNPANVQLLEMMLKQEGYENVTSVTDSRKVKSLFQKWRYDLILLDIRMPHLDGFQVMEQLSEIIHGDYMPVLVLTAQTDMETKLRALKLGANDFCIKPFDRAEVLNRISNMLEVRYLYNLQKRQSEILDATVRERTIELEKRNQELHDTRLEIIHRLGRAGEYRDNETGMHVIRMSKNCQLIAQAAGLGEDLARRLLDASPMHDVGKIGIPDGILLKPGKLDGAEWEIMKSHAEIGADIVGKSKVAMMVMARSVALTHHEKWDGSGYPKGLKGSDIPIEGRIAAVADVFDALTSERPYKHAWPVAEAAAFINENAGSHFDREVVRVFNEKLPEILKIRDDYSDD